MNTLHANLDLVGMVMPADRVHRTMQATVTLCCCLVWTTSMRASHCFERMPRMPRL